MVVDYKLVPEPLGIEEAEAGPPVPPFAYGLDRDPCQLQSPTPEDEGGRVADAPLDPVDEAIAWLATGRIGKDGEAQHAPGRAPSVAEGERRVAAGPANAVQAEERAIEDDAVPPARGDCRDVMNAVEVQGKRL